MKKILIFITIFVITNNVFPNNLDVFYLKGKKALKEGKIKEAKESFFKCFEIIDSSEVFVRRISCSSIEYSYGELNPNSFERIYFWMAVCFKIEDNPLRCAIMLQFAEGYNKKYNWRDDTRYVEQSKTLKKWIKARGGIVYPDIEFPEGNNVIEMMKTEVFDDALEKNKKMKNTTKYQIKVFDDQLAYS